MSKYDRYYLMGRRAAGQDGEDELEIEGFDVPNLASRVLEGEEAAVVVHQAIAAERAKIDLTSESARWQRKNKAAIRADKLDADEAYNHYVRGWIDQARTDLNDVLVEELFDPGGDEDEEGDDDEEEDDEEQDGEDEGGDGDETDDEDDD